MTSKFKEFHGTSLSEKDFAEGKVLFNHDELKADFAWDTGVGIGAYLAGLKRGEILGSYCSTCRKIVVPPRADLTAIASTQHNHIGYQFQAQHVGRKECSVTGGQPGKERIVLPKHAMGADVDNPAAGHMVQQILGGRVTHQTQSVRRKAASHGLDLLLRIGRAALDQPTHQSPSAAMSGRPLAPHNEIGCRRPGDHEFIAPIARPVVQALEGYPVEEIMGNEGDPPHSLQIGFQRSAE